jgi:hypothetical protein
MLKNDESRLSCKINSFRNNRMSYEEGSVTSDDEHLKQNNGIYGLVNVEMVKDALS